MNSVMLKLIMLTALVMCDLKKHQLKINKHYWNDRIVGGETAYIHKYPFLVYLLEDFVIGWKSGNKLQEIMESRFACGGSIVAISWALTAAHCLYHKDEEVNKGRFKFRANTTYNEEKPKHASNHKVLDFQIPNCYRHTTYDCNLAVVKVKEPFRGVNIKSIPVAPPNYNYHDTKNPAFVYGWGATKINGKQHDSLQRVQAYVVPDHICSMMSGMSNWTMTKNMFCSVEPERKGACKGDEGGPIVRDNIQIGIVSWNTHCRIGQPTVYTKLSQFSKWIREIGKRRRIGHQRR